VRAGGRDSVAKAAAHGGVVPLTVPADAVDAALEALSRLTGRRSASTPARPTRSPVWPRVFHGRGGGANDARLRSFWTSGFTGLDESMINPQPHARVDGQPVEAGGVEPGGFGGFVVVEVGDARRCTLGTSDSGPDHDARQRPFSARSAPVQRAVIAVVCGGTISQGSGIGNAGIASKRCPVEAAMAAARARVACTCASAISRSLGFAVPLAPISMQRLRPWLS
jgi:hypothetical protein